LLLLTVNVIPVSKKKLLAAHNIIQIFFLFVYTVFIGYKKSNNYYDIILYLAKTEQMAVLTICIVYI